MDNLACSDFVPFDCLDCDAFDCLDCDAFDCLDCDAFQAGDCFPDCPVKNGNLHICEECAYNTSCLDFLKS